jgi:hypothetical protein
MASHGRRDEDRNILTGHEFGLTAWGVRCGGEDVARLTGEESGLDA